MKRKKIVSLLCVVAVSSVVGCGNVENTMSKNSDNVSSVETVDVVATLEVSESVESSVEVPSGENLTNVLEETGSKVNYDRGESTGEAIINRAEEQTDSGQTESEITASNGQLDSTINEEELPDENRYYIKKNADGSRTYSKQLISDCLGSSTFDVLTEEEVIKILDAYFPDSTVGQDDSYYREELGYMDKELAYSSIGKDLPDNTKTDKNNQQATNQTGTNQNTSNNLSDNQNSESATSSNTDNTTQNTAPSTEPTLTQEQLNELYAPGGPLANFNKRSNWGDSGESWNGVNGRD